jgi:predicted short-subunit dehydrogenase-like oxidoreductase (DUF2520 family)
MYTIIGNGRLAQHFIYYFNALDLPFNHWYRSAHTSLAECLAQSSHVLLLISDKQIEPFIIENHKLLQKHHIIHCSGAHISAFAYSAHPLMTFNAELYTLEEYHQVPFILEKEGLSFAELLPGLPNPHAYIPRSEKPYYHAICVMANNFTTLLWQKFFSEFQERFHLPENIAMPLLTRTFQNLQHDHQAALTGPLIRNDLQTIEKNLHALTEDDFYDVYRAFLKTAVSLQKEFEEK